MIDRVFPMAHEVVRLLLERKERVVLAESCTAGFLCALLGQVPGVSECLCGSFVTYRPESKRSWLNVRNDTIDDHTTESIEVAEEMALGALMETGEADWSIAVVGHLGPNAPEDQDGKLYICIACYSDGPKVCQRITHTSPGKDRVQRQRFAAEFILSHFGRCLVQGGQPVTEEIEEVSDLSPPYRDLTNEEFWAMAKEIGKVIDRHIGCTRAICEKGNELPVCEKCMALHNAIFTDPWCVDHG